MLDNAHGVLISGKSVTLVAGNQNLGVRSPGEEGIKILLSYVAPGALHNSGERFDPPKCHPNTRVAIHADILNWLDELESKHTAIWMRGAAGAGKSAIAQMIAEICHRKGQLSSSFFFSRTSDTGRNNESRLVSTLAYQLSQTTPAARNFIGTAVSNNPLVFDLSLEAQMETLIIGPLLQLSEATTHTNKPMLILIDGLDECGKSDAQHRVVHVLLSGIARLQHQMPHKLFITSRPEHNIISAFNSHSLSSSVRQLPLDDSCNPDEDIRLFLVDSFAEIIRKHPFFETRRFTQWPQTEDVETLIKKSSGQFIYSAVVIKYIQSEEFFSPIERLNIILQLKDTADRPYADLDSLYQYIFEQVKNVDLVLKILSIKRFCTTLPLSTGIFNTPKSVTMASKILDISEEEVAFSLRALSSILSPRKQEIYYLHASLPDFLTDDTRSGSFYIHSKTIYIDISQCCLMYMANYGMLIPDQTSPLPNHLDLEFSLFVIPHFSNYVKPEDRTPVYAAISNVAIESLILKFSTLTTQYGDRRTMGFHTKHFERLGLHRFLQWIITESKKPFLAANALSNAVMQMQVWLMSHLCTAPFNGFDNSHGIDLWAFSMLAGNAFKVPTLEVKLALKLFDKPVLAGEIAQIFTQSEERQICWQWMPYLAPELDLAQEYQMTDDRYARAAHQVFRYMIKLFKSGGAQYSDRLMEIMTAPSLLLRSACRTDLYFTLLVVKYLISQDHHQRVFWDRGSSWTSSNSLRYYIDQYLAKTRALFPVLFRETSAEYCRLKAASLKADDRWTNVPAESQQVPAPTSRPKDRHLGTSPLSRFMTWLSNHVRLRTRKSRTS